MRSHPASMAQLWTACCLCGSSVAVGLSPDVLPTPEDAPTHSTVPPVSKGPTTVTSDVTQALRC